MNGDKSSPGLPKLISTRVFSDLARCARNPRFVARFWKLAGLRFDGRELRDGCMFDAPDCVTISEGTFVNYGCVFHTSYGHSTITIGRNCDIAPQVMFMCTTHELGTSNQRASTSMCYEPIVVGDGVWIGARAIIMPGIHIGDGAVVGAGAIVTHDVAPNTLVAGVPAKVLRQLD